MHRRACSQTFGACRYTLTHPYHLCVHQRHRFFTGIVLNTIDTIFICFAMDCDSRQNTRPEVHQIYGKVPSVAKAVEAGCWSAPPPPYEPPRY